MDQVDRPKGGMGRCFGEMKGQMLGRQSDGRERRKFGVLAVAHRSSPCQAFLTYTCREAFCEGKGRRIGRKRYVLSEITRKQVEILFLGL